MVQEGGERRPKEVCELPISDQLKVAIATWDTEYQCTLNHDDPLSSKFSSRIIEQEHSERGASLAKRLQNELGGSYVVEYRPICGLK